MLIVLEGAPCPTPLETMLDEETIAEVLFCNLIFKRLAAIDIRTCSRRLDEQGAILPSFYTGIVKWIDVDSHAQGMIRQHEVLLACIERSSLSSYSEIGRMRSMGYFAL